MEQEILAIYDEQRQPLGTLPRAVVHQQGHWHETFHCWFFRQEGVHTYLLFQRRAASKKDFPLKLDITAAGHLLAGETVRDGVREVAEEVGITIAYHELLPVGVIPSTIEIDQFIDREFCHVYLYHYRALTPRFLLQQEEVADMIAVESTQLEALFQGKTRAIEGRSCLYSFTEGPVVKIEAQDLCPHSPTYAKQLMQALHRYAGS
ncbi:putative Nudix hydrolase [Ktedonobacter sp. SOSP1-52]|uniref:NUDIX hydrolase n=1 Tax=Ktedonobacter sp. SOSP1-52 TaxID=2778366 RepID=UPI0019164AFA|nr:NUDIX domain-containing protein [Ktedonobacter sp. SOSP1-52]GHO70055.1 putative Nudix hydrolase [Ktedonobacter sp. SOSP1-52]